jgi:hypothetical protein
MRRFYLLLLVLAAPVALIRGQNLESIGKEKPFTLNGGVSLNQIFYSGSQAGRDPYSYVATGNVNIGIYGWTCPLSFTLSNQNYSYQQPFNQYSIHPTYKFVTGHLGYTSMSFSPYTVNGHIFLGAGVDIVPEGKWKFSGLYGRFLKAVEPDTVNENPLPSSYKRMGYGFKASYGEGGNSVDLILFHAKDDIGSRKLILDSADVLPEENLVISIGGSKTFLKKFVVKGEFATSAITRDLRADRVSHSNLLSKAGFLYKSRTSSSYYNAYKTSLDYQLEGYTIGVGYERIEPEYRTLGAYYFNNDLENITVNGSAGLMQGKMSVAASFGKQRDNLNKAKISTMRRTVGSINVNYMHNERLTFSTSYSSFQTFTNIRSQFVDINQLTPYDNLDTLNFTQLSRSATLTSMYSLGKNENRKQSLMINLTYQGASDKQGEVEQNSGMDFYNVNSSYSLNVVPYAMTVSLSLNATLTESVGMNTRTYGPTASVTKSFFDKKLRTTLSASYNETSNDGVKLNTVLNTRLGASINIRKKHALNFSSAFVDRKIRSESSTRSVTDFTGTLGYSYAFGIQ